MNSLRLGSGMRLRSDSGIFTVTACSVFVIPKRYYLWHYTQAYSCPRLANHSDSGKGGAWRLDRIAVFSQSQPAACLSYPKGITYGIIRKLILALDSPTTRTRARVAPGV